MKGKDKLCLKNVFNGIKLFFIGKFDRGNNTQSVISAIIVSCGRLFISSIPAFINCFKNPFKMGMITNLFTDVVITAVGVLWAVY